MGLSACCSASSQLVFAVLHAPPLLPLPSPCPPPWLQVPGCSLWFNGTFYDNVSTGRRGVTSLNWPKPKIKLDSKQGSVRQAGGRVGAGAGARGGR